MQSTMQSPKNAKRDIERLAENSRTTKTEDGMTPMGSNFVPGTRDVICARGKLASNHPGNCRFRVVLEMNLQKYSEAKTKLEKSSIVSLVVDLIREGSPNGGFIKRERGEWYEVGDYLARQKVGQCLRDLLHTKYRSSTKAKAFRRKKSLEREDSETSLSDTESSSSDPIRRVSFSQDRNLVNSSSEQLVQSSFSFLDVEPIVTDSTNLPLRTAGVTETVGESYLPFMNSISPSQSVNNYESDQFGANFSASYLPLLNQKSQPSSNHSSQQEKLEKIINLKNMLLSL